MALSDKTNQLVKDHICLQYPTLEEGVHWTKKGPTFAGPSLGRKHMKIVLHLYLRPKSWPD